ncbi:sigma-54-dependent Fis family transcriptional regulator [Trichlorobacter lovleyi]|uniref:sigma-54-dependent transcriptional regulator n=1 Tax=Trichlorobacter lovleyi TaxID=313985 RepID=UPI00223F1B99|nr:sigma 54-interacting transcriptional regulator [Trichlorobacter lovleyi]QOX78652.1 sigma-54-dependent Fis family transcriptional regulator [Trichlorobacter lovleyi]
MKTLHILCDFWEQSVSRALHELRRHERFPFQTGHIHAGNLTEKLELLLHELRDQDHVLINLLHADSTVLQQAAKLLGSQKASLRSRIRISYSRYSPDLARWAEQCGTAHEINQYEAPRHSDWEPLDTRYGTTLAERRWIQYRMMRTLIGGEQPKDVFNEIFKKLRSGKLSETDTLRSQRFYERDEPDMAGGQYAEARHTTPNAIDLLRERAVQVGRSGLNTLIIGETGTGKESLAWYLHDYSTRFDRPFLALNCAFFEGERLESELFGHELGAFTDAKRMKKGLVEEADGGTLFLDELPEMAPRVQAKLLRFLQDGTYTRLGGTKAMRASVRVISAAQPGRLENLRQDLYFRVADVELHTVPLQQMKQRDIVNIACNLAYRLMWRPIITATGQSILTPDAIREVWGRLSQPEHAACLAGYAWPGNMRELSTLIKRFVLLGDDIFQEIRGRYGSVATTADEWQRFQVPVANLEDLKQLGITLKELQPAFVQYIVASLGGREAIQPTKLAETLGCSYNTLMSCLATTRRDL